MDECDPKRGVEVVFDARVEGRRDLHRLRRETVRAIDQGAQFRVLGDQVFGEGERIPNRHRLEGFCRLALHPGRRFEGLVEEPAHNSKARWARRLAPRTFELGDRTIDQRQHRICGEAEMLKDFPNTPSPIRRALHERSRIHAGREVAAVLRDEVEFRLETTGLFGSHRGGSIALTLGTLGSLRDIGNAGRSVTVCELPTGGVRLRFRP